MGTFLMYSGINWVVGYKTLSIGHSLFGGAITGFIFHLPSFVSALIMNLIRKPILRFDVQGFYYTPQIWSKSRLIKWDTISSIKVKQSDDVETGYKCIISIYLFDGKCISLNEKIRNFFIISSYCC